MKRSSLVAFFILLARPTQADDVCAPPLATPGVEGMRRCADPGPADEPRNKEVPEERGKKDSGIIAFPIAFYTSDTSFGFGGTAILFKKSYEAEGEKRSDSFTTVLFYTLNNQVLNANAGTLYLDEGRYKADLTLVVSRYPEEFYGLGPDSPWKAESYTPLTVKGEVTFSMRLWEKIYGGIAVLQGYHKLYSYEEDGPLAAYVATNRASGFFSGLGLEFNRDSRDASLYPRTGALTTLSLICFNSAFLSDYSFTNLVFDHRQYHSLSLDSVLAWQFHLNTILTGDPPLPYLPALGSQNLMRGYPQGRYRDKLYVAGQVEWRVPIWWRFGAVVFAGVGTVERSFARYLFDDLKFAAGAGLRITLSKKNNINFRFDFGMSAERPYLKLYFNLIKAF